MRKIYLTGKLGQGKYTLVDDRDFGYLNSFCWYLGRNGYACYKGKETNYKGIYLHRLLINPKKGFYSDHINRDRLDNRRSNLRIVDGSLSSYNQNLRVSSTSGYKGISWSKNMNKWLAHITKDYKTVRLGYFSNLEDAINTRKHAEKEFYS